MRCIKMPNIQNLVPNARASISFPLGMTYQKLYFSLGSTGLLKSMISNIVLKINNKEFQRWNSAADLDIMNAYKGNNTSLTAYLVFDFTERLARTEVGLTLGTIAACQEAGVQSFTLEFDVGAWTVTGGTSPSVYADVDAPSSNRVIQRVQMQQKALSAAVQDVFYIPFGAQGYQLARILMKNNNVTSVKIRRDGVDVFEDLPAGLMNFRGGDFGRNPQSGWYITDFLPDTLNSNALNTAFTAVGNNAVPVQNLDARVTTSAADTITIYTQGFSLNSQL